MVMGEMAGNLGRFKGKGAADLLKHFRGKGQLEKGSNRKGVQHGGPEEKTLKWRGRFLITEQPGIAGRNLRGRGNRYLVFRKRKAPCQGGGSHTVNKFVHGLLSGVRQTREKNGLSVKRRRKRRKFPWRGGF